MKELTACPLCRTNLPPGARQCPGCSADLSPYQDIASRAGEFVKLAGELLSRGELERARLVIEGLPQLTDAAGSELDSLRIQLATARGELELASQLLEKYDGPESGRLAAEIQQRQRFRLRARELYNTALSVARAGQLKLAARQLASAVEHDAKDARIWTLKLKADLASRNFQECYTDLAALDRLAARPPQFTHLEELLPPVARLSPVPEPR